MDASISDVLEGKQQWCVVEGDCLEVMRALPDACVDAVVTDPPYELGFMGNKWDASGIAYQVDMWREVLRVLKPGGHLLSFGGTRTYHRMTCAIEDAGFEVRDCIFWCYGSGFPKSLDVSKAIDKAAGAKREVVGRMPAGWGGLHDNRNLNDDNWHKVGMEYPEGQPITAPATPEVHLWQGWGTALKPAVEPVVMARKPLSEKTVAANVLKWGAGAINVDGTRIETSDSLGGGMVSKGRPCVSKGWDRPWMHDTEVTERKKHEQAEKVALAECLGRWPANLCLDEEAAGMLDEQSGERASRPFVSQTNEAHRNIYADGMDYSGRGYLDKVGASRFFYCAKASRRERNEGCEGLPVVHATCRPQSDDTDERTIQERLHGRLAANHHPTVKPVALMRWLCRMVTPPNGVILDPFCGSGSTGCAAVHEHFRFIGIELEPSYCDISRKRIAEAASKVKLNPDNELTTTD